MAIAPVTSGVTGIGDDSGTTKTVTLGATVASGDVVVFVYRREGSAATTFSWPATPIWEDQITADSAGFDEIVLGVAICRGSDVGAGPSFAFGPGATVSFNDVAAAATWSGVDSSTPLDGILPVLADNGFGTPRAPDITTGTANAVHVAISGIWGGGGGGTPTNYTNAVAPGSDDRIGIAYRTITTGDTSTGVVAWTGGEVTAGASIVLREASAGPTAPDAPTGVTVTGGDGEVLVGWTDETVGSPDPTYNVDRGPGGALGPWTSLATGIAKGVESYLDGTAANGTTYSYRVQATNSEGSSAWTTGGDVTPEASANDIKVQRGELDVTTSTTITLAEPVADLTKAFVRLVNNRNQGAGPNAASGNQQPDDMGATVTLTALDTITVNYSGGAGTRIHWEVTEYVGPDGGANEFRIRHRGEFTLAGATNTGSETCDTTPTNIDDCIPYTSIRSDVASGSEFENVTGRVRFSGSNTIDYSSAKDQGNTVIATEIVEYVGSNWTVHVGSSDGGTADSGTITLGSSVTDWAQAAIVVALYEGDQTNEAIADHYPRTSPAVALNQVDYAFDANHDGTDDDIVVYVLEHADTVVTRYSDGSSTAGDTTVDITSAGLTDITQASIFVSATSSGSGTALGRGYRGAKLNSTTQAAHYAHRSGNTVVTLLEVVDWAGLTTASGGSPSTGDAVGATASLTAGTAPASTVAATAAEGARATLVAAGAGATTVSGGAAVGARIGLTAGAATAASAGATGATGARVALTAGAASASSPANTSAVGARIVSRAGVVTGTEPPGSAVGARAALTAGAASASTIAANSAVGATIAPRAGSAPGAAGSTGAARGVRISPSADAGAASTIASGASTGGAITLASGAAVGLSGSTGAAVGAVGAIVAGRATASLPDGGSAVGARIGLRAGVVSASTVAAGSGRGGRVPPAAGAASGAGSASGASVGARAVLTAGVAPGRAVVIVVAAGAVVALRSAAGRGSATSGGGAVGAIVVLLAGVGLDGSGFDPVEQVTRIRPVTATAPQVDTPTPTYVVTTA